MTILYIVQSGGFIGIQNLDAEERTSISDIYVNITNRCPCSCDFCIRKNEVADESNSLWLEQEPSVQEIIDEFESIDINNCREVIFCGFGEPLERIDEVVQVSKYLKNRAPGIKIRVNTNGLR